MATPGCISIFTHCSNTNRGQKPNIVNYTLKSSHKVITVDVIIASACSSRYNVATSRIFKTIVIRYTLKPDLLYFNICDYQVCSPSTSCKQHNVMKKKCTTLNDKGDKVLTKRNEKLTHL